jgi:cbb3-type cytochrome oxidase cytochrome c subunit
VPGEYVNDSPHLLGTRRIGPDLARVGGKYHNDWHRAHFIAPREVTDGSVMPDFPWLFAPGTTDGENLIAYVQSLGRSRHWREQKEDDYEEALPNMPEPPKPVGRAPATEPVVPEENGPVPTSEGGGGL